MTAVETEVSSLTSSGQKIGSFSLHSKDKDCSLSIYRCHSECKFAVRISGDTLKIKLEVEDY